MIPLMNHLWQSTLFTAVAGLLTLAFRKNRAQVRYSLWLAASVKFLFPFSILVTLGGHFGRHTVLEPAPAALPFVIEQISQPFVAPAAVVMPAPRQVSLPVILWILWAIGSIILVSSWCRRWLRVRAALRAASPVDLPIPVKAMSSPMFMEPGVFGIFLPVLLLPGGIEDRLTPAQFEAILAHELCHLHRRDNLASAIHMAVEALFWFHPLVWWIGAHLLEERERACDEEVLQMGSDPAAYAEGILKICELYLESPLPCAAGVTGANLKKRIEAIMNNRVALRLNFAKKATLATAGIAAVAVPVAIGVLNAPSIRAQSTAPRPTFEVASVKPIDRATMHRDHEGKQLDAQRYLDRTDLYQFIVAAYIDVAGAGCILKAATGQDCPFISGNLPAWVKAQRWEIQGKLPPNSLPSYTAWQLHQLATPQLNQMLQVLLEDRFHLRVHRETRELPVYAVEVGKDGPKLTKTPPQGELMKLPDGRFVEVHGLQGLNGVPTQDGAQRTRLSFRASSIRTAAQNLQAYFDRPVIDQTGLPGEYDFMLEFEINPEAVAPPPSWNTSGLGGNFFNPYTGLTASELSQSLQAVGLKLESKKAPVEVLVIDHVEIPTEN